MAIFALSNGPLAWAIVAWRNSMVFHSIDKVTSILIHLGPPILCASLRHVAVAEEQMHRAPGSRCLQGAKFEIRSVFALPLVALVTYVIWQLLYLIIVVVFRKKKKVIEQRNYATSFSYLYNRSAKNKKRPGLVSRVCGVFGSKYRFAVYTFLQFLYAIVTILPTKLLWDYPAVHELFLGGMTTISVWNAANFYIEIFSKRYATEVQDEPSAAASSLSKEETQKKDAKEEKEEDSMIRLRVSKPVQPTGS